MRLPARLSAVNSGSHSLVFDKDIRGVETIPVTTRAPGAARRAQGHAALAAAAGHRQLPPQDDPAAITAVVWEQHADYRVASKDLEAARHGAIVPKVLFFY